MRVKIYGLGWVGESMLGLFPNALTYDPDKGWNDTGNADIGFVCVPTPNPDNRQLDTSIVEEVVKMAKEKLLIIRSTLNPGTCDYLEKKYKKNIVFMPEYLGETVAHPLLDDQRARFLIIGGEPENRRKAIDLFQTVYNASVQIRQVTNLEAEIIKLSENRAIAFKVAQCQELYDACEAAGVDYYTIREAVYGDDPRFNRWFTAIYPKKRGANSKCIPKDVYAWASWANMQSTLTSYLLTYNDRLINENS